MYLINSIDTVVKGYVLSRESLMRLGGTLVKNYSFCNNTGTEDVDVARCLRRLGSYMGNSLDEQHRESDFMYPMFVFIF